MIAPMTDSRWSAGKSGITAVIADRSVRLALVSAWVGGVLWLCRFVVGCVASPHALRFCITPIPYCVQRWLGFVKAGKMP
jgi:hypothetical protein